jgi:hypothetical protein
MGCAWVPFKGRIAPGMLADLVVLGDDISRVPVEEVCDIPVAMTIVGAAGAHRAPVTAPTPVVVVSACENMRDALLPLRP